MNIAFIGPTGSGKTTVARKVAADLNVPLISSGEIARELSMDDPATDLAIKSGAFAPEQAMRHLVRTRLEAAEIQHGSWILDGFPRTTAQLICLMQWTSTLPTFVYFDLPVFTCIERLTARNRPDDNPDSIARKIESWYEKTQPMVDILEDAAVLYTIRYNGMSVEDAAKEIESWVQ